MPDEIVRQCCASCGAGGARRAVSKLESRWKAYLWRLADEQMNVLGHDDVGHERKSVAVARLAKKLYKRISSANRAQQWKPPIASECDEVKVAAPELANEFVSHGEKEKSKPRPSKCGRGGHPEGQRLGKFKGQCLMDDVPDWYYPTVKKCQMKKRERMRHPPAQG